MNKNNLPQPNLVITFLPMDWFQSVWSFIRHWRKSKKWNAFHSPYLFQLFTACIGPTPGHLNPDRIERIRKRFIESEEMFQRSDYGAGSSFSEKTNFQKISTIARYALSPPAKCRFLANLAHFIQANNILELGTSLGISASYLAMACPQANVITIEGDPVIADKAIQVFAELELTNVRLINQRFDQFFQASEGLSKIDLCYIDGHHTSVALLQQLNWLEPFIHERSIIVVDDIHWSEDMSAGWLTLTNRPGIRQSIDCFSFGMLFFNPNFLNKENHQVRLPLRYYLLE